MPRYLWDESIKLGLDKIDREHKCLISYMNKVYDYVEEKRGKEKILLALGQLRDFAQHHFTEEENHMKTVSFPEIVEHQKIHQEFLVVLDKTRDHYASNGKVDLPDSFFSFLETWLYSHIRSVDRRYVDFSDS